MYANCIFCRAPLGTNEVVEHFPVGQRLAFDAAKGRLWVVCHRCERWNLTPLEERWEAIEECERAFRGTTLRVCTDNIGLARLRDGTELVRIGKPLWPEFAAWRYGDQFGRRRRRMLMRSGVGLAVVGGAIAGGAVIGVSMLGAGWAAYEAVRVLTRGSPNAIVAILNDAEGHAIRITRAALAEARLAWDAGARDWALELPTAQQRLRTLQGPDAIRAAAFLMPAANRFGGNAAATRQAIALFEHHGHPEALFRAIAAEWDGTGAGYRDLPNDRIELVVHGPHGYLTRLAPAKRLALEMAAHEDTERLALKGELRALEAAWRSAEEIAAIADDLLLPSTVRRTLGEQ